MEGEVLEDMAVLCGAVSQPAACSAPSWTRILASAPGASPLPQPVTRILPHRQRRCHALQKLLALPEPSHGRQRGWAGGGCEPAHKEPGDAATNCHAPDRSGSSTPNPSFQPEIFGLQVFGFLMNSSNFLQKADTFLWKKYSQKIQFSL